MLTREWLDQFKRGTETKWATTELNPVTYGFQFQPGTKWNPGLSDDEIITLEEEFQVRLPDDFRLMLSFMNGTDLPTKNIYGSSGYPHRYGVGVYSFPRDTDTVHEMIERTVPYMAEICSEFGLDDSDRLLPIYAHRFIVCTNETKNCEILSIMDHDAIHFADTLHEYLKYEFLAK